MKIFVSYSRRDAGDFAKQIQRRFSGSKHDVFTDVNSIKAGDDWSDTIEDNITKCEVFVVLVTYGALESPHVENELLQAQREKKKIVPCFYENVRANDIKWGLEKKQGVEFSNEFGLARDLFSMIESMEVPEPSPGPKCQSKKEVTTKNRAVIWCRLTIPPGARHPLNIFLYTTHLAALLPYCSLAVVYQLPNLEGLRQ